MTLTALVLTPILLMVSIKEFPTYFRSGLSLRIVSILQAQTPPSVQLTPAALNFGKQVLRKRSVPKRITITNVGGTLLYINSAAISGDNWKDFTILNDSCSGKQVGPGKSCIIAVTFTPTRIEDRNACLVLTDNAPDSPQNLTLTGTGINSIDVPPF